MALNGLGGIMEKFLQWATNRHEYAREWKKKTGKKLVGYLCTYSPEELFYAAGVLPVRIFAVPLNPLNQRTGATTDP